MKYQKIPTNNLGTVAYYLLQITQGVFKWNGELFFCPFVIMEDKQNPFQVRTWNKVWVTNAKWSLPFINDDKLFLFADPVHPSTYIRTKQRSMDKSLGIDSTTVVLKKGTTLIVKRGSKVDVLEFVKKLSDSERSQIFDPNDEKENYLRRSIWRTSKKDSSPFFASTHRDKWLRYYEEHQLDKRIPSRFHGRVKQFMAGTGDW